MDRTELAALWRRLYRSEPPARAGRRLLALAVGWALQAEAGGGLAPAVERQLQAVASGRHGPAAGFSRRRLKPGTRLVREWHGTVHVVEAAARGYLWQERRYASLSAIAREITGATWSGPRFFGLPPGAGS